MRDFAPCRRAGLVLALSVGLMLVPSIAAQEKVYVDFGGSLPGESTDPAHPDWVEAYSLSYGRGLTPGGGGGGGILQVRSVTFIKETDRTSPFLLAGVSGAPTGVIQDTVTIEVCREVPTQECYYRLELSGVVVSAVDQAGSTCIDPGSCATGTTESVTLFFSVIRWTFIPFSGGKAQTPVESCWSNAKNAPACPP